MTRLDGHDVSPLGAPISIRDTTVNANKEDRLKGWDNDLDAVSTRKVLETNYIATRWSATSFPRDKAASPTFSATVFSDSPCRSAHHATSSKTWKVG